MCFKMRCSFEDHQFNWERSLALNLAGCRQAAFSGEFRKADSCGSLFGRQQLQSDLIGWSLEYSPIRGPSTVRRKIVRQASQ